MPVQVTSGMVVLPSFAMVHETTQSLVHGLQAFTL